MGAMIRKLKDKHLGRKENIGGRCSELRMK